jgi:hypothetical protein
MDLLAQELAPAAERRRVPMIMPQTRMRQAQPRLTTGVMDWFVISARAC